jgi:hypothetical protein
MYFENVYQVYTKHKNLIQEIFNNDPEKTEGDSEILQTFIPVNISILL